MSIEDHKKLRKLKEFIENNEFFPEDKKVVEELYSSLTTENVNNIDAEITSLYKKVRDKYFEQRTINKLESDKSLYRVTGLFTLGTAVLAISLPIEFAILPVIISLSLGFASFCNYFNISF